MTRLQTRSMNLPVASMIFWLSPAVAQESQKPPATPLAEAGEMAEPPDSGAAVSTTDLAKKSQNPVSNLISLPFESDFSFGAGSEEAFQYTMQLKPVYPQSLNENWNWIHRALIPVAYTEQVNPFIDSTCGLGDIQYQGFLSPANDSGFVWGVGPTIEFPSATQDELGTGKWSAGPGVVGLRLDGPWVYGALVTNIWSFAGEDGRESVSRLTAQPFVNYNFEEGWYATSSPVMTYDWTADSHDGWTVPLGGGLGKVVHIGKLPVNISLQGFYYVQAPETGPDWSIRLQVALLFPKGKT